MTGNVKKGLILVVGWVFLILGIAGFFLPILQGFLFVFIGLAILSSRSELAKRMLERLKTKYPKQYELIQSKKEKLLGMISRRQGSHQ